MRDDGKHNCINPRGRRWPEPDKGLAQAVTAGRGLSDALATTLTIGILGSNNADALAASGARFFALGKPSPSQDMPATPLRAKPFAEPRKPALCLPPRVPASPAFWQASPIASADSSTLTSPPSKALRRWKLLAGFIVSVWKLSSAATRVLGSCYLTRVRMQPSLVRPRQCSSKRSRVTLPALRTTVSGQRSPMQNAQTIRPDAKLLFVAGAGWTKKQPDGRVHISDAETTILNFLGRSGASLGSSKSLVDQRGEDQSVLPFMTHLNQIGQTGATPRHPKGLSTCCHGEEPHVVGWRFISERRAISLDANCGWTRGKADVVYVADAFQVMTKVNALLQK